MMAFEEWLHQYDCQKFLTPDATFLRKDVETAFNAWRDMELTQTEADQLAANASKALFDELEENDDLELFYDITTAAALQVVAALQQIQ